MDLNLIIIIFVTIAIFAVFILRNYFGSDAKAQRQLNDYLNRTLTSKEIGTRYERYIGYLYESEGYDVVYNGAVKGFADLGRDLIVRSFDEVLVIQAKCWAKGKFIQEKDIFQLYGTTAHFQMTSKKVRGNVKPVFYTSANFSDVSKDVANVLDIELIRLNLNPSYPMIKCRVSKKGRKSYHLPFDDEYDTIKMNPFKDDCFVATVKEAVQKGFQRAA